MRRCGSRVGSESRITLRSWTGPAASRCSKTRPKRRPCIWTNFAAQREAYDYALAIQQHAAAGEDFAALSKTYDQGLSGQAGGLGIGNERGKIQPADVEPAVWALEPGKVSELIETPAGYHIVK